MNKLIKYPIIIIAILVLSFFLKDSYEDMFSKRESYVRIDYSPVSEEFMQKKYLAGNSRKVVYSNLDGTKIYTRKKYEEFFPFSYFSDLIKWGTFPEKFSSFEHNIPVIMSSKQYSFLRQSIIDKKDIGLYPLFEAASDFTSLQMPDDFFRFNTKIEFINTLTNKINESKSQKFTKEFIKQGFSFPIKKAFGNPTTRKPFDEGYFLIDNKNSLYHFKMIKKAPFLRKINTNGINIEYMKIEENSRKEYYGLVLSKDKKVYLLMYDDYEFVNLPIDDYDYKKQSFLLKTDPLYRHITIEAYDKKRGKQTIKNFVTNLDYELLAKNVYEVKHNKKEIMEFLKNILFTYELDFVKNSEGTYYIKLANFSLYALYFNIFLFFIYIAFIKLTNKEIKEHLLNTILILSSGLYAVICIFIFERLFYFRKKR